MGILMTRIRGQSLVCCGKTPLAGAQFLRQVPASRRAQYVAAAIAAKLREHEEEIMRDCELGNNPTVILDIETSFVV